MERKGACMEPLTLGQRIVYFRKKAGIRQTDLAAIVGIKQSALSYYEKDRREPSVEVIRKISQALNITGDTLLGLEPYPDLIAQSRDEYTLLHLFRKMNRQGRVRALDNVRDLSEVPKYSSSAVRVLLK